MGHLHIDGWGVAKVDLERRWGAFRVKPKDQFMTLSPARAGNRSGSIPAAGKPPRAVLSNDP